MWANAKSGPWSSKRTLDGVRIFYRHKGKIVTEICRGERYAHIAPGLLFDYEQYQGSYANDWHGGPHGSLTDMIEWIEKAEGTGPYHWFKE